MADQFTPVEPSATDPPDLRRELDRSNEEILRLRDLLIGKDAELGSLKGQVAQLEAGTARLLNLVSRIRSLLPGFVWSALAALRRRRGQQS
jgi:hypothetical protein